MTWSITNKTIILTSLDAGKLSECSKQQSKKISESSNPIAVAESTIYLQQKFVIFRSKQVSVTIVLVASWDKVDQLHRFEEMMGVYIYQKWCSWSWLANNCNKDTLTMAEHKINAHHDNTECYNPFWIIFTFDGFYSISTLQAERESTFSALFWNFDVTYVILTQ